MASELANNAPSMESLVLKNAKTTKLLYAASGNKRTRLDPSASLDPDLEKDALSIKLHAEYKDVQTLPEALAAKQASAAGARRKAPKKPTGDAAPTPAEEQTRKLIEGIPQRGPNGQASSSGPQSSALTLRRPGPGQGGVPGKDHGGAQTTSLISMQQALNSQPKPDWHAPWKLSKVIAGSLGWVRSVTVEPNNKWFATGAGDRTIKIWDLATAQLRLTLTGHISTVRGLAVSPRHPYLFSVSAPNSISLGSYCNSNY